MADFNTDEYEDSIDPWGYESNPDDQLRKQNFVNYLPKNDFSRVLDIGVGTGFVTRDLNFTQFVGVDISLTAVNFLNTYFANLGKKETHKAIQMSILDSNFSSLGVFDLVIVTGVLYPHYLGKNRSVVIDNLSKVTQTGSFVISVHISESKPFTLDSNFVELDRWLYPYRSFTHEISVLKKII
jgi:SAM-dependent methyltransferase